MTARRAGEAALALALALLAVGFLLRGPVLTGFERVSTDDLDGILQLALLEHWRNVLAGAVPWHTPAFFHPVDRTLGYNDGYLFFGLVHSAYRALGLEPAVAQEAMHATFRVLGFLGVWLLGRRCLGLSVPAAAFAAALVTTLNFVTVSLGHSQLALAGLAPFAFWLGATALSAAREGQTARAALAFAALGLLFGPWLLSGFYMAWFTGIVILAGFLALLARDPRGFGEALGPLVSRGTWAAPLAGLAVGLPFLAAFLWVYLPKLAETGGHAPEAVLANLPQFPHDLINVGSENLVWSLPLAPLYAAMTGGEPPLYTNVLYSSAFTPLVTLAFAVAALTAWRRTAGLGRMQAAAVGAALVAVPVLYLVQFRFGDWSPWLLLAEAVPGAAGVRVVTRLNLVLAIPVALVLALWLERRVAARSTLLAGALGVAMLVEQVSLLDLRRVETPTVTAFLETVPPPPPACEAFYVTGASPRSLFWPGVERTPEVSHWVDADIPGMLAATAARIPTLNGHASFLPEGWFLKGPFDADYLRRIREFAEVRGVTGLCAFDLAARAWSGPGDTTLPAPAEPAAAAPPAEAAAVPAE